MLTRNKTLVIALSAIIAIVLVLFLIQKITSTGKMVIQGPENATPDTESTETTVQDANNSMEDASSETVLQENQDTKDASGSSESAQGSSTSNTEDKPKDTNASQDQTEDEPADSSFIKKKLISWGYQNANSRNIDTIIIHSSYDALGNEPYDVEGLLDIYKQYGVSAHYLIDRKGTVYQLVEDKNIAYHAGVSSVPDGRTNVNYFSIGIEVMNTKDDDYTSSQYKSLNKLLDLLNQKYKIKYTLGHSDIAPGRKDDPWNFDWDKIEK